MNKEKGKILILVEGPKTDFELMKKLLKIYGIDNRRQIISYKTNIYALYNSMFRDADPADLDILQHLKEHEPDSAEKLMFDERYSDILLVFDLDPHDPQFSPDSIIEMMGFFTESSDMGKLYLNYPMVEAFYHMRKIPDLDYDGYTATLDELKSGSYKACVNSENRNRNYTKFAADKDECDIVIGQNISKAWNISGIQRNDYLTPDSSVILKKQLEKLDVDKAVAVLCTCAFYIADYNPRLLHYDT